MLIRELPQPVTASKADWLAGTTWLGFTPTDGSSSARSTCQSTIQRQFKDGYVIEYITERFSDPNIGFENDPLYLRDREEHKKFAGRFIAVHKLRATSRPLEVILGPDEFAHIQDVWAQPGKRFRWSVAFPIIETYEVTGQPKAKDVLGEQGYLRLYAHSSGTLRPLSPEEQAAIANLEIEPVDAKNAWIGIEDEIVMAIDSDINVRTANLINTDLNDRALEGMPAEKREQIRRRAAWLADKFVRVRKANAQLFCDDCGFDPAKLFDPKLISLRSLLDVHHKNPLQEGIRYTTINDFALLCPTCHRVEHAQITAARISR